MKHSNGRQNKGKLFSGFLCLLLALCLSAGCAITSSSTSGTERSSIGASSVVSDTESAGDIPIREETDFFTEHGMEKLPAPSAVPGAWKPTDEAHLYQMPLSLPQIDEESGYGYSVEAEGAYLLFSCWYDGEKGFLYSLQSGEWLCAHDFSMSWVHRLYADGSILNVRNAQDGSTDVFRYLPDGSQEKLLQIQAEICSAALSEDGNTLAVAVQKDGISLYDLQSKAQIASFPYEEETIGLTAVRDGFVADNYNGKLTCIKTADRTAKPLSLPSTFFASYGGLYHCSQSGGILLCEGEQDGKRCYASFVSSEEALQDAAFGWAVTGESTEPYLLRFYDLRDEHKTLRLPVPEECYTVTASFLQSGRVLLFATRYDGCSLYLYDLPAAVADGYEGETVTLLLCTRDEVWERAEEIARATEEKNGVELLYGSEGNDFCIYDYVGVAELDPYAVYQALCETQRILEKYPAGMLREAYEGTHKGLRIYLCGTLYGVGGGGLTNAGAVTTESDGYLLIALDCSDPFERNLPHELSHVFDRRIEAVSRRTGTDWMKRWEEATEVVNPYANDYAGYESLLSYTWAGETDLRRVWFTDAYARTFPTEDRARIMESLCNPGQQTDSYLQCTHLKEKAELYCRILRECFPSCRTQTPFWEAPLQT